MEREPGKRAPVAQVKRPGHFITLSAVGNRAGAAYMLVAAVGLSFVPTVIALSDGGSHPCPIVKMSQHIKFHFMAYAAMILVVQLQ